ncbi:hypothetical protein ACH4Q6_18075 [Streptomyces lydicus]|uniref:hypothetical protein n=1 Tax=Streptomyces lydicus TaxID=47763 RepID=UPI0037A9145D
MTTVSFEQVTRCCPGADRPAVDALHLDIADGEFLVLGVQLGGNRLPLPRRVRAAGAAEGGGDRVVTGFRPESAYFFSAATGERLPSA